VPLAIPTPGPHRRPEEPAVADGDFTIKVKLDVAAGKEVAFSETAELMVPASCLTRVPVPAGGSKIEVSVCGEVRDALDFQFLLVRPVQLGPNPIKPADLVAPDRKPWLEYGVPVPSDPNKEQRKPLRGTHVFVNGQTEWVTDMLKDGGPGGLTRLWFWNNKAVATEADMTQAEKDKLLKGADGKPLEGEAKTKAIAAWATGRHDIVVQVVAGYSPVLAYGK
jgi:hypothetical protein